MSRALQFTLLGVVSSLLADCGGGGGNSTDAVAPIPTAAVVVITSKGAGVEVSSSLSFPESLLSEVRALPGVAAAVGGVGGDAKLVKNGKVIKFDGAPQIGFSLDSTQPWFNQSILKDGEWPGSGEVAIDTSTARRKQIEVGDTIGVRGKGAERPMYVSGLFAFSSRGNIGGATLAAFDVPTGQQVLNKVGELDQIRVAAKPGVSKAELLSQIRAILPPQTEIRGVTGDL